MMRNSLLFVAFSLTVIHAGAKVIPVCGSCDIRDVAKAVELAEPCDIVKIAAGTYNVQQLVIDKEIEITGEPGALLDGGGKTILYVQHEGVTISNLDLQNVATNYVEDRAAIKCHDADYLVIDKVRIRHAFFGILVEKSRCGLIADCDIQGDATVRNYLESSNGNAIHLWYCKDMHVRNNRVRRHRDGIYFEFVENTMIEGNLSQHNMRYGLHFMFSHGNRYTANTFSQNGAGVAVMYSTQVHMVNNRFVDNWGESAYGLLLKDITDSELYDNVFDNNTIAISADNTSRVNVHNNSFRKNGYAMRIMGNCVDNTIAANDFCQNSFDITTNARSNYNDFDGNYWEEFNGYDLDRNGTADVPYRPVKLFTYVIAKAPASILLIRSTFIDLLNLAEKVTPVLTPESLIDEHPAMKPLNDHLKRSI